MGLFGGGSSYQNPADAAEPYLDAVPGTVSPFYNPSINLGKGAARTIVPIQNQMATNPQGIYNQRMSGYQESDAYKYNQQQLTGEQAGVAAAGGFTGTPYDQQQQAATTAGLLAQDQNQYYNNISDIQNQGLNAGMQYMNTGYEASDTLANLLANNLAAQSELAYKGAANQNAYNAQRSSNMWNAAGTAGGTAYGISKL